MKKINKTKLFNNKNIIITIIFFVIFSFMTIGFARYGTLVDITGNISVSKFGKVFISGITLTDRKNASENSSPNVENRNIFFDVNFSGTEDDFYISYLVEITNDSVLDFIYVNNIFTPTIVSSNGQSSATCELIMDGIEDGDVIKSGEKVTFTATLRLHPDDPNASYDVTAETEVEASKEEIAYMLAALSGTNSGDLRGTNRLARFDFEVTNTFNYQREFSLKINNTSNFSLCDSNGNALGSYTIGPNETKNYSFYIKENANASLPNDTEIVGVTFKSTGIANISLGNLTLLVDINYIPDTTAPVISDVTGTINNTEGRVDVSWQASDTSSITNYHVLVYNSSNTLVRDFNTNSNSQSYSVTGLSDGQYYFVVYGVDSLGNTATQSDINSATTDDGYASRSALSDYKWNFTVTFNLTGMSSNSAKTVKRGQNYTATFTANNNYNLPNSITVTMEGNDNPTYTYNRNNSNVTIQNVTGNITISGQAEYNICLGEGTKILMADYTYKNIEDVRYDDLVLAWNYETGNFVKEYPLWLKKPNTVSEYRLTKFSDGTILKSIGDHGIFSADKNEFININDIKVGERVIKLKNEKFITVKVTESKMVHENIKYYDVISTRYYNVFANDLLTTDGVVIFSNLYGFNKNITFKRKITDDIYTFEELNGALPYYMYLGFRAGEGKYIRDYVPLEEFSYHLKNFQYNLEYLLPPISKLGNRYWMVTTSEDIVNDFNKSKYLVKEGSIYTLPKGPKKWYCHSDNKYYYPGDKVTIWFGSYFEAVY